LRNDWLVFNGSWAISRLAASVDMSQPVLDTWLEGLSTRSVIRFFTNFHAFCSLLQVRPNVGLVSCFVMCKHSGNR
jgi:hypothetical protein